MLDNPLKRFTLKNKRQTAPELQVTAEDGHVTPQSHMSSDEERRGGRQTPLANIDDAARYKSVSYAEPLEIQRR
jgi:hypothetical protein